MLLHAVAEASRAVAAATARNDKVAALAALLADLPAEERAIGVALLVGELRQGRIGVGWKTVQRVLPAVAAESPSLTLAEVDAAMSAVAAESGSGSSARKLDRLGAVFARATAVELDLLAAVLGGGLRQGALEGVMVSAVAKAAGLKVRDVKRALMFAGDLGAVTIAALDGGTAALDAFGLEHFRPLRPMLAQTAADPADAFARLGGGEVAFEHKLDGARVAVHRVGDRVAVYTRRLHDVTRSVPEVVERVAALPCRSLVLDGEVFALRPDGRLQPFQTTMRRFGRVSNVDALRAELPLSMAFFDCLELDGRVLVDEPAHVRRSALESVVPAADCMPRCRTARIDEAEEFVADALEAGHEGVMVKALDGGYEAGGRASGWLKIKPVHTLDLVVLAAEWGHGRRRGRLSNLHLGARDDEADGGFVMLGKTFKGLTDDVLAWQTEALLRREVRRDGITVHVRPELVIEIALSDVQRSPQYPAGLALRFARVKGYRADKAPSDADTIETVRRLHAAGAGD